MSNSLRILRIHSYISVLFIKYIGNTFSNIDIKKIINCDACIVECYIFLIFELVYLSVVLFSSSCPFQLFFNGQTLFWVIVCESLVRVRGRTVIGERKISLTQDLYDQFLNYLYWSIFIIFMTYCFEILEIFTNKDGNIWIFLSHSMKLTGLCFRLYYIVTFWPLWAHVSFWMLVLLKKHEYNNFSWKLTFGNFNDKWQCPFLLLRDQERCL